MRALLSVWDKTGLVEFAAGLVGLGAELVASGGTASALREAGIAHLDVADVTGFPEMLGGRVKTLHPKIHAGILADRAKHEHMAALEENDIEPIDLVVCNLYPFSADPSVELIDIGGPAMVRAAAKNHQHVGVVTNPGQYPGVLEELTAAGSLSNATRHQLARAAFAHTAAYDAQIVRWLDGGGVIGSVPTWCATARIPIRLARAIAERARCRGGTASSSTPAARCRISISSTLTPRGAWCTNSMKISPDSRAWRSSSTPMRRARRSVRHWATLPPRPWPPIR